jgi:hypothetical protein
MTEGTERKQPDLLQTYFLYMAAGVATIPAALAYATLQLRGLAKPLLVIPIFAVGVLLAHLGAQFAQHRLLHVSKRVLPVSPAPEAEPVARDYMTAGVAIASWIGVLVIGFLLYRFIVPPNLIPM